MNMRNHLFTYRVVPLWNAFPHHVIKVPSLKTRLDALNSEQRKKTAKGTVSN